MNPKNKDAKRLWLGYVEVNGKQNFGPTPHPLLRIMRTANLTMPSVSDLVLGPFGRHSLKIMIGATTLTRFYLCAAVLGVSSLASSAWADPPPPAEKLLIYCDLSPGSIFTAKTSYRTSLMMGKAPTLVTESAELITKLAGGPWAEVNIAVKWTAAEPAWLSDVRKYAAAHPETQIAVSTWHDAGQAAPNDFAIRATVGTAYWRAGQSNIGYTFADEDNREKPTILPGLLWPPFDRIIPEKPVRHFPVASPSSYIQAKDVAQAATSQPAQMTPVARCEAEALDKYWTDCITCSKTRREIETYCDTFHGRNAKGRFAPDPIKHYACMVEATDIFEKCTEVAIAVYHSRLSVCPGATTQPSK